MRTLGTLPLLVLTVALLVVRPAPAQTPAAGAGGERRVTLTLEESVRAALTRAPEVRQAEAEVEGIRGKQLQARGAGFPQMELTTILGPSPRARGDQVSSPDDQYSPRITGVFVRAGIEIIQPVFTWGLIQNARQAAEHGVRATQAGVDLKGTEVALKVKQAYWGLVTATMIRQFLLEIRDQVDDTVGRTERLIEGGFTSEVDVYRLRTSKGEIDKNLNLVDRTIDLARSALATWTGQPRGTVVEPADKALPTELRDLRALELFIEDARAKRPEFTQLREGINARRNLVEVERKKRYPLFFVGILGSAAYATNRDRLENPFVVDPLNHVAVGPVVGFRFNLDFGIQAGKIKEAEAEVHKLEALQDFAEDGIPLQVREAYDAVVEAQRNVKALDQAHRNGRQWLVAASSNFDLGVGEPRDLSDAFLAYAKTRGEYLQALFAHVYGLEQLAHAAGMDVEEIRRLVPPETRPGVGKSAGGKG
ncbi:MAG TPA: TolC family protein [Methylomirabilota bacterium]|jgi:outer membrane protein TolC|nr:TolC family protein [Methylomirabilota bacterium]